MSTIKQLIEGKNKNLAAIAPTDTVLRALEVMAAYDVGALLVLDGERLAGVFSERDYARKVILKGKSSRQTKVSEVMTGKVFYVTQESSVEACMALMTEKHIRHVPVMDGKMVVGVVSIGDVVMRVPSSNFKDGQAIQMASTKPAVAASAPVGGK